MLNDKSPAEVHLMAHRASETLKARLRGVAREHADRMRQLNDVMRKISAADFDEGQTLAGMKGISLSPEVARLIIDPTKGL